MPSVIPSAKIERALRTKLRTEGYEVSRARANGETGVDILATRRGKQLHIEVISFKSSGPARSKDFMQSFFRAISRIDDGAKRCIIALAERSRDGLPQRARQYGSAWRRIGLSFPELEIWLVDHRTKSYTPTKWNDWLSNEEL